MTCITTECLNRFSCMEFSTPPIDGAVFTPFVEIKFQNEGEIISVGNRPGTSDAHVCIKSFQYGSLINNGTNVKIEIIDEGGKTYRRILHALNKTFFNTARDMKNTTVRWGWIISKCDDARSTIITNENFGGRLHFLPGKTTSTFDNGVVKINIELLDMAIRISEDRSTINIGTESDKMPLKAALRNLFMNSSTHHDIYFEDKDKNVWEFHERDGGPEGPRAVWTSDQQNVLSVARRWISPLTTKNNKGILMQWDAERGGLVFLEDPNPGICENEECCKYTIGTYIVNGGNCSPVISFNPTIDWNLMNTTSGGTVGSSATGASAQANQNNRDCPNVIQEPVGIQTQAAIEPYVSMFRSPDDQPEALQHALTAHDRATKTYDAKGGMTAELKIQGDPALSYTIGGGAMPPNSNSNTNTNTNSGPTRRGLLGKTVNVIVINPFYISKQSNSPNNPFSIDSKDHIWLAQPACHPVLSNKKWRILGVDHQIQAGSYTTTLKLMLDLPNRDIDVRSPLGGRDCSGPEFELFTNAIISPNE